MSKPPQLLDLQSERDRLRFEIRTLEHDIERIRDQIEEAEGSSKEGTDWWHRATGARQHKERERRVLVARCQRLTRKIGNVKPDARKAEAKENLREILRGLLLVARTSLAFYEDESEDNETAFTDALDQLDQLVPDWDQPQEPKPVIKTIGLGD